ncbi:hypothetical protein [Histidinibacterium lentulum]|nr:hypothetical protein [Histidinibacterium lentulum]
MADHETWLKKTLADILGEDRGLPDYAIDAFRKFGPEDLDELRRNERQAVMQAIKAKAHESRDSRGGGLGEGAGRPAWTEGDMDWALRAAKSALEAEPAGKRSEKAEALLADCECPSATGPNPGQDTRTAGEIGEGRKP